MSSQVINGEPQPPRSCDRCHAIKERCDWTPDGTQCKRCIRLQHVCETTRPKGRPGRKPGVRSRRLSPELRSHRNGRQPPDDGRLLGTGAVRRMGSNGHVATVPKSISELGDMSTADQQLVQRMFQSDMVTLFSVGSSFREKVRAQVIPHLVLSKTMLMDGLLACAISWAGDVDNSDDGRTTNPDRLTSCYRHASSALATLASLQVTNTKTMADCLMLGALVSTFALRLRLRDVLAISGRTLGLIAPVYAVSTDSASPDLLVFLSCIVLWELRGCLFSCAVPSLRFRPPAVAYADRHVGLCATLLPLLHDICTVSHALAHNKEGDAEVLEELDTVERLVQQWKPAVPDDFISRFDGVEVAHILCQAQAMRLAALLVTHRLRYPFGVNDQPAKVMSATILTQLQLTLAATRQPVRCVDLALLVACLELRESAERHKWLPDVAKLAGFSPQFGAHVQGALVSFWAAMDLFKTISWGELTALGSPFLRNPS